MSRPISRRTLLRGAGGIAIGLPFLEAMIGCSRNKSASTPAVSQAAIDAPKRVILMFSPNGTVLNRWTPSGSESNFTLSDILSPLQPHQGDLLILNGLVNAPAGYGPGDDHERGIGCLWTGKELQPGPFQGGAGDPSGFADGISVDQEIANRIGTGSRFKSLEFGVQTNDSAGATVWDRMCYAGPNQPLPPTSNPYTAFDRIFGDMSADQAQLARRLAQRRSVLDAVIADYGQLAPRLGVSDRQKLEAHLTSIREVELRLAGGDSGRPPACQRPDLGTPIDHTLNDNFPVVGRLQMDLLAMAFACDLTRVASLQWSSSVSGTVHTWVGVNRDHHGLSHESDDNADAQEQLMRINRWYAEQLAYLIAKLKQIPEGQGTVFDNTVILWSNELAKGNAHSHAPLPMVLAGSAGGVFRTGRFLSYDYAYHNDLLIALLNAFGVQGTTFGNPSWCRGPLANLT